MRARAQRSSHFCNREGNTNQYLNMRNLLSSSMIAVLILPLTNFAQKDPSPGAPGSAFYSFQHPEQPPLPFNLFPDLPLYEVEPKVYVIDDRRVDYSLMMTGSGDPPVPGPGGGQPQPPPVLSPHSSTLGLTSLWVNIPDPAHKLLSGRFQHHATGAIRRWRQKLDRPRPVQHLEPGKRVCGHSAHSATHWSGVSPEALLPRG